MSRTALDSNEPQTCIDDLESFYYTLVYIAMIHTGRVYAGEKFPSPIDNWESRSDSAAKCGFLLTRFRYTIDPRLRKPFQTLVERLYSMFRNMVIQVTFADMIDGPPPVVNHEEIYDVISCS